MTFTHKDNDMLPEIFYVTIYLVDRAYGGAEEGGWWYDTGEPVLEPIEGESRQRSFDSLDDATAYLKSLNPIIERLNEGRPDISSVLSQGRYHGYLETHPPESFPGERPHYE